MSRIALPSPHGGQRIVRSEAQRFNWLSAGRRWRKTTLGVAIAIEKALEGKIWLIGAPTYDQVRISWNEAKKACDPVANFTQTRMTAEFPTGGQIIFRSLDDPNNARGWTFDGANFDEVGYIKASAYYDVVRPMLIDTNGEFWGYGTPNGRNWFWVEWLNAKDRADSAAWQVPTLGVTVQDGKLIRQPHPLENPDIPFEEVENLYKSSTEKVFQQEILAAFIESEGAVFRRVMDAVGAPLLDKGVAGNQYCMGVDWGKINDYTVLTVIDIMSKQVVHIDRFSEIDYIFQRGRLKNLWEKFNRCAVVAEENSMGMPVIEELRREGIGVQAFKTTNASKANIIESLALAFESGDISIPRNETLIGELLSFEGTRMASGMTRYAAPEGMHDDTVMSLALAYWGASGGSPWLL